MNLRTVAFSAAIFLPCLAVAAPTTVTFAAVTEFVRSGTAFPGVGTFITGSFVFDYDPSKYTKFSYTSLGLDGAGYEYFGAPYNWTADLGNVVFTTPYLGVEAISNGVPRLFPLPVWPGDAVSFATKRQNVGYSVQLFGPADSFDGADIPSPTVLKSFWTSAIFEINDYNRNGDYRFLTARVTDISVLSVTAVPEPTELSLMLSGLVLVLLRCSRKKARIATC